ncbi:MAG: Holliday junction resolvase RuvX [Nitrosomonadales bacterium]|jgi:putative Holliday junction resolvase
MREEAGSRNEDLGLRREEQVFGVDELKSEAASGCAATPRDPQSSLLNPIVGTLLAFDFGTQRIGVAVGNTFSSSAEPLVTISEEKNELRFKAIAALVREWQPCALVVGLPCSDDGTPHELTALCQRFAKRLHGRYGLTTLLVDERYSSLAASEQLNKQGIRGREQKSLLDEYAAQQILQAYFDEPAACVVVNADRGIHEKSAAQ